MLEGVMWAVGMLFAVCIGYALFRFGQILADKKSKGKATAIAIAVAAVFGHIATLPSTSTDGGDPLFGGGDTHIEEEATNNPQVFVGTATFVFVAMVVGIHKPKF